MFIKPGLGSKRPSASFKPDIIANSVSDINFAYLKNLGITTCFLDLDGTVVSRGTFEVSEETKTALRQAGLDIKIATNRPRSRSLKELKQDLGASGVIHPHGLYGKPTKRYLRNALHEFGLERSQVIMIGDRFLQDVWGANRSGVFSLLVFKLGNSKGKLDSMLSSFEKQQTLKLLADYQKV